MPSQKNDLEIIGIAGLPRSGKDTLAQIFIDAGYFGISLGDIVRNISRTRHAREDFPISRENTTETSNWLRKTRGLDFTIKEALRLYEATSINKVYKGLLMWSIRTPLEADFILNRSGRLIWLEASDEVRHRRAMINIRDGEAKISLQEFKRQENQQWVPQVGIPNEIQMNVSYVKTKSNEVLSNNFDNTEDFKRVAIRLIESDKS
jgi:dephospho-CoA kinase